MHARREGTDDITEAAFVGLTEPARELLLQMLLYKSVFVGHSFRTLAGRETSAKLRSHLLTMSHESVAEAAGVTLLIHEWDKVPGVWDQVTETIQESRHRLLLDLIHLKEGMTETGLSAAMRAPTDALRKRFLRLVDIDRRHADELRAFLGTTTTMAYREVHDHGLGAHDARGRRTSLGREMRQRLEALRAKGVSPQRLVLSPDGVRHLRDEEDISEDGRWLGLPIDIDSGWEGDVFAIVTDERITYAELVVAMRASEPGA